MRFSKPRLKIQKLQTKRQLARSISVAFLVTVLVAAVGQINFRSKADTINGLNATYFGTYTLSNSKLSRIESNINFDWGAGRPDTRLNRDNFSARFEGYIQPKYSETYNLTTLSDDGVRLWVNNTLIIDNWSEHPATQNTGSIALNANQKYSIKMEYYERWGDAVAKLSWQSASQVSEIVPQSALFPLNSNPTTQTVSTASPTAAGANAQYFIGQNFETPIVSRVDNDINFDWGFNSPDPSIPADNYSARWNGTIIAPTTGNYTFYTESDDGVRVWVNNLLVINNWTDHPITENMGITNLEAGKSYPVKVEYYENSGESEMMFMWSSSTLTKQVVPFSNPSQAVAIQPATNTPLPVVVQTQSSNNPFSGAKLYVNSDNDPAKWARDHRQSDPFNASLMDKIGSQSEVEWLGNWNSNISGDVTNMMNNITAQGALPVFVVYNLPNRDCGGYSSGGMGDMSAYQNWISQIASSIGNRKAAVILEPDALSLISCLSSSQLNDRYTMLKSAVSKFKSQGVAVYIDAGHPNWISASDMANRLQQAGVDAADGFALNIANFYTNDQNASYGKQISDILGGKHFITDTGRNGSGTTPDEQWCNPAGRSLGTNPTTNTGNSLIDAYLWIKGPGGSDGQCNGGPAAGIFWPEYALGLAQRTN